MSDATTHLLLPYILAAQAQKHITHNEALRLLDGLVQLSVLDRDLTASPGSPADGDRYIVASGATGAWAGWDLNVALWTDGAWLRLPPRAGWRAWVEDEGLLLVYDGSVWIGTTPAELHNMALLGIGTTADAANPFSAKLNAALWTARTVAEGGTGDLFYTMNKESPSSSSETTDDELTSATNVPDAVSPVFCSKNSSGSTSASKHSDTSRSSNAFLSGEAQVTIGLPTDCAKLSRETTTGRWSGAPRNDCFSSNALFRRPRRFALPTTALRLTSPNTLAI